MIKHSRYIFGSGGVTAGGKFTGVFAKGDSKGNVDITGGVSNLSKEKLISAGGNAWSKGNKDRVYLNNKVLEKMGFEVTKDTSGLVKKGTAGKIKPLRGDTKVWFDVKKGTLHSNDGTTRVNLNRGGFKTTK